MIIGNKIFNDYTYVMGIVNVTPDSFYNDSRVDEYTLLKRVEDYITEGASIIDLGGQSTRPGASIVSEDEELKRIEWAVKAILSRFDVTLSIDTFYSKCANEALSMGAHMINDITGLTFDSNMAKIIADHSASVCIMHNKEIPSSGDMWHSITSFLIEQSEYAVQNGIKSDAICIDGGLGFLKTPRQSLSLLQDYDRLSCVGYPLLMGASRKSFFGGRVEDRLQATIESTYNAAKRGVLLVRVHDVKQNVQAIRRAYGQD